MPAFAYEASPDSIRPDMVAAYRAAWAHLATPGRWLTGAQRVAVAEETRRARDCTLCRERKDALSPFTIEGEHDQTGRLSPAMVDEIHRITSDAARLTESWLHSLLADGLLVDEYVEALGVAVIVISIDRFHHALGLPLEPLPAPQPGEPTRVRPDGIAEGEAWVPMLEAKRVAQLLDMPMGRAPFVLRALSLVPEEVLAWRGVSDAQYLGPQQMMDFGAGRESISRAQIELVAGRVSSLNECFY